MITLHAASPVPPSEQIRSQIAGQIRDGRLSAGQRLPPIRQIAGDLRVAAGTVAKAYAELEAAGLIESSRARGSRVRPGNSANHALRLAAQRLVEEARASGVSEDETIELVRSTWGRTSHSQ